MYEPGQHVLVLADHYKIVQKTSAKELSDDGLTILETGSGPRLDTMMWFSLWKVGGAKQLPLIITICKKSCDLWPLGKNPFVHTLPDSTPAFLADDVRELEASDSFPVMLETKRLQRL